MASIFENPLIINGQGGSVVLFYENYIIGNIAKKETDLIIERINKDVFNVSEFESIVDARDVTEYEFELGCDSNIKFTIKKNGEKSNQEIRFQNVEVAKEAEIVFQQQFKQLGFKREKMQLTPLKAAVTPGLTTLCVAGGSSILTWFAYAVQDYETQRRRIKWYVYLFDKLAKAIGYIPFLVLTIVLTLVCLLWLFRRMVNPPYQIKAVK
jgi:hypothetical protein